jgi:TolB protein
MSDKKKIWFITAAGRGMGVAFAKPDGSLIAFSTFAGDGASEIFVMPPTPGAEPTRLTFDPAFDVAPDWSPDGTRLAFMSDRDGGNYQIYTMAADGGNPRRLTWDLPSNDSPDWGPRDR